METEQNLKCLLQANIDCKKIISKGSKRYPLAYICYQHGTLQ